MKALITGVCGQDGYYLSRLLLDKGYEVIGTRRGNEEPAQAPDGVIVEFGDVTDAHAIRSLVEYYEPDEIYNLAAITHVGDSFSAAAASFNVNAVGCVNCLNAAVSVGAKFYQASTSELFGDLPPPQDEDTPMHPRSPYAVAKLAAYWMTRSYRDRGAFAVNGILFNHESPRRGGGFVTQKVVRGIADIISGKTKEITLGNLDAARDWGHAEDFVQAMWMMMQEDIPQDYVVATGQTRTVRDLCEFAFSQVGLNYLDHVKTSKDLYRPLEVERLQGNPARIRDIGWKPKWTFEAMIKEMLHAAIER